MNQAATISCGKCQAPLPSDMFNLPAEAPCPNCGTSTRALVFAAFHRPPPAAVRPETVMVEGDAGCFFHPAKKAVVPCANCGRFLCALCDLDLNGRHLCPNCLDSGKQKGRIAELETQRSLYPQLALTLALVSWLFGPVVFVTAPVTLYLVIRYWNRPGSLVRRRSKWWFGIAAFLSVAQLVLWIGWFVVLAL